MSALRNATRLGAAAAAASAALVVAGCGSSAHSTHAGVPVSGTAISRAADISGAAKGEKVAYLLTEKLPTLGTLTATGTGSFNNSPRQGQLSLRLSVPGASSFGAQAASILSNLDLNLVVDHQSVYVKLPSSVSGLASAFTHGKSWISVDLAKLASSGNIPGLSSLLNGQTPTDPAATLTQLQGASTHGVTKVGAATVNGVSTTEYTGTLDLSKLSSRLPASIRSTMKAKLAKVEQHLGLSSLPFTVYIDSANLVRRVQFNLSNAKVGGQSRSMMMRLDFLAYGKQPAPAVPAASQVDNLDGLIGSYASKARAGKGFNPFGG
jgi:hypothetical protein